MIKKTILMLCVLFVLCFTSCSGNEKRLKSESLLKDSSVISATDKVTPIHINTSTPIPINTLTPSPFPTVTKYYEPLPTWFNSKVDYPQILIKLEALLEGVALEKQEIFDQKFHAYCSEFVGIKAHERKAYDAFYELLSTDIHYRYLLIGILFNHRWTQINLNPYAALMLKQILLDKSSMPEVQRFLDTSCYEMYVDNELVSAILDDPDKYLKITSIEKKPSRYIHR